jgi:hypothetical protein
VLLDPTPGSLSPRSSDEGLMEFPLVPGRHYLKLMFEIGWPERYGVVVTIVSLTIVAGGMLSDLSSIEHVRRARTAFTGGVE